MGNTIKVLLLLLSIGFYAGVDCCSSKGYKKVVSEDSHMQDHSDSHCHDNESGEEDPHQASKCKKHCCKILPYFKFEPASFKKRSLISFKEPLLFKNHRERRVNFVPFRPPIV